MIISLTPTRLMNRLQRHQTSDELGPSCLHSFCSETMRAAVNPGFIINELPGLVWLVYPLVAHHPLFRPLLLGLKEQADLRMVSYKPIACNLCLNWGIMFAVKCFVKMKKSVMTCIARTFCPSPPQASDKRMSSTRRVTSSTREL